MPDDTGVSAQRPQRKPHRKSRTGCLDCRRRRVKCGEERPSCRACVRRNDRCEYQDRAPSPSSPPASGSPLSDSRVSLSLLRSHSPVSAPTPATSPFSSLPDLTTAGFSLTDLRLLHHWTVFTSNDLCRCPEVHHIWQILLPHIGFKHPFVLHALLGLAALHIAHQDLSEKKIRWVDAVYHHSKALEGFQKAVHCITEENSEALFTWSICNILYVFAMSNPLPDPADPVSRSAVSCRNDKILGAEWIPMIRGLDAILAPTDRYLRFGRMSAIMSLGNWGEIDPDRDRSGPEDAYFCGSRQTWKDSNCPEIYEEVLQTLRKSHLYSQQFRSMDPRIIDQWGYNRAWSGPLMFIHFAPESYFSLLRQRQPPALILFAFFGALLHELNDYWFLEGWGKAIVEVVEDILGSYWKPWISWPLQVVRG